MHYAHLKTKSLAAWENVQTNGSTYDTSTVSGQNKNTKFWLTFVAFAEHTMFLQIYFNFNLTQTVSRRGIYYTVYTHTALIYVVVGKNS